MKRGALQAAVQPVGLLPGEQHLGGGAGAHGQLRADRDGVAQADGPLGGGDADAVLALAAEELGALAGDVAQRAEHRAGGGEQPVLAGGGGELGEPRAEDEAALQVAGRPGGGARGRRRAGGRSGGPGRSPRPAAARVAGPASSALSTSAALSRTPTPLELSMS